MSDLPSPPWLDDAIEAELHYQKTQIADMLAAQSDGYLISGRGRRGFDLDMLIMDEADRLNDE